MKNLINKYFKTTVFIYTVGSILFFAWDSNIYAQGFFKNWFHHTEKIQKNETKPLTDVKLDKTEKQGPKRSGSVFYSSSAKEKNAQKIISEKQKEILGSEKDSPTVPADYVTASHPNISIARPASGEFTMAKQVRQESSAAPIYSGQPPVQNKPLDSLAVPESAGTAFSNSSESALTGQETLEQAWTIAVEESRKLQAGGYKTNAGRMQIDSARGLAMPKVVNNTSAISMNEQESVISNVSILGMPFSTQTKPLDKDFVYSVTSVSVPLYLGGKVRALIDSAKAATNALEAGQLTDQQDLKAEVTKLYLLVLRVRSLLKVAQDAEMTIAAHEKDAARLFENGLVTNNVVLAAQVARANAKQDVIKARNSLHLAEAAYNRLLWRPLQSPVNIQDVDIPPLSGDLESLQAQAVGRRSELSALASTASALNSQIQVHRGTRMPNLSLIGAHSYIESENLQPNSNLTGAVTMVWMPFDGGTSRAQEESARFQALAVSRMREDAKTAVELQVYQAWLNENETHERLDVMKQAVEQADENMRVVTRKFHEGLINHTEVLDAQTQRTLAWNNFEHAKYDTIQAVYDLKRALGSL